MLEPNNVGEISNLKVELIPKVNVGKGGEIILSGLDFSQVTECSSDVLVFNGCHLTENNLNITINPKSLSLAGTPINLEIKGITNPLRARTQILTLQTYYRDKTFLESFVEEVELQPNSLTFVSLFFESQTIAKPD